MRNNTALRNAFERSDWTPVTPKASPPSAKLARGLGAAAAEAGLPGGSPAGASEGARLGRGRARGVSGERKGGRSPEPRSPANGKNHGHRRGCPGGKLPGGALGIMSGDARTADERTDQGKHRQQRQQPTLQLDASSVNCFFQEVEGFKPHRKGLKDPETGEVQSLAEVGLTCSGAVDVCWGCRERDSF